ncbi:MAG: MerR family transcriptional regulator [Bacteroidetes bacterium]|nr:MerR family transcriptional regulator [Bacteroidota bacterium]MBU1115579.1 MerR family transcriptional regulator [Bacteroidota bacterium]MBU1799639.1 MerR family transcriptional regulator [Bacteroidota bacterium]
MENTSKYNIKSVSLLTNLNIHTIRAWEKRYSAVTPERTDTNRRMYSKADIEKLNLLSEALKNGHSIGSIAHLSSDELRKLIPNQIVLSPKRGDISDKFQSLIEQSIYHISNYDYNNFENLLLESSVNFSRQSLLVDLIIPLLEEIGNLWENGKIRVTHEHFAVSVLRTFLGSMIDNNLNPPNAPKILTTTPEGFLHELGALIAALYAMDFGWNAIFLGANLPAEEISAAAKANNVNAILLSLVYPSDDPRTGQQLRKLRKYVGDDMNIIISGQSAIGYMKFVEETNSVLIEQLNKLQNVLLGIRQEKNE